MLVFAKTEVASDRFIDERIDLKEGETYEEFKERISQEELNQFLEKTFSERNY